MTSFLVDNAVSDFIHYEADYAGEISNIAQISSNNSINTGF